MYIPPTIMDLAGLMGLLSILIICYILIPAPRKKFDKAGKTEKVIVNGKKVHFDECGNII